MAATILLSLAPIYGAWDYGAVEYWPQWLLASWIGLVALLTLPVVVIQWRVTRLRFFVPFGILILICLFGFMQSVQLPSFLVGLTAPGVSTAYQEWVPAKILQEASESNSPTLVSLAKPSSPASLDAGRTRNALIMPAIFLLAMLCAAFTIRSHRNIMAFLLITMFAGGMFAFTGIADAIRPDNPGLEQKDLITPEAASMPFGPFVNRNNAAGYLGLCLAACVGTLVFVILKRREKTVVDQRYAVAPENWWQRPIAAVQSQLRDMDASAMTVLTVSILIVAGVAISGSRGGFLGVLAGVCAASLLTGKRGTGLAKSLGIVVIAVGTAGLLGLVGMMEAVSERLETIWASDSPRDGRLDHWGDGLTAALHYFPGGSGLGTYRYAYLPFQESSAGAWFVNADGMPIEWLVEGGLWLLPMLLAFLVLVIVDITSLARLKRAPHITALIAMGWFAIGSTLVSQSFDFGVLLPPFYITLATMFGAIVGASDRFANQLERAEKKKQDTALLASGTLAAGSAVLNPAASKRNSKRQHPQTALVLATICSLAGLILICAIRQSYAAAVGAATVVDLNAPPQVDEISQTDDHLLVCSQLIEWNDEIVVVPSNLPENVTSDEFRRAASVLGRRAAYHIARSSSTDSAEQDDVLPQDVLLENQSFSSLGLARQHALAAILKSPLSAEARYRLAELDWVTPASVPATAELLEQFAELRSRNPQVLINGARLALMYPGPELSSRMLKQVLEISPESIGTVWPVLSANQDLALAMQGLPDNAAIMVQLLETNYRSDSAWRSALLERAINIVNETVASTRTVQQHVTAGRVAMQIGDWDAAARSFESAVDMDAATIEHRYRWALALERAGNLQGALEQINRCQLREPTNKTYQNKERELLEKLRAR